MGTICAAAVGAVGLDDLSGTNVSGGCAEAKRENELFCSAELCVCVCLSRDTRV